MMNIVTIMAEVGSFKDWLPITPVSEVIKEVTPLRKLLYLQNQLQWPFWPREIFLEGAAYVLKEEKALGLSMESVKENSWFGHEIQRNNETFVETHINKGFTFVQYLSEN
jgi:hypothetical protein